MSDKETEIRERLENIGPHDLIDDLRRLLDENARLRAELADALKIMSTLHSAAVPDEDGPDIDAIIPAAAFRAFVDAHAQLLYRTNAKMTEDKTQ